VFYSVKHFISEFIEWHIIHLDLVWLQKLIVLTAISMKEKRIKEKYKEQSVCFLSFTFCIVHVSFNCLDGLM